MAKKFFIGMALSAALLVGIQPAMAADNPAAPKKVVTNPPTLPPIDDPDNNPPAVPAAAWFPILPYNAEPDAIPQLLPIAANHGFGGEHPEITRAIIAIHDTSRDANGLLNLLSTFAGANDENVLILAPQFLLGADIMRFTNQLPDGGEYMAHWILGSWEDGGASMASDPRKGISSFAAIDLLLAFLGEKDYFPSLKDIVVIGHGAGADFVLRYAATGLAPELLENEGVPVRFAAANPSSYIYFTSLRPIGNKPGFALPKSDKCPAYNSYKYGLDNLNEYGRRTGANAIRLQYVTRRVTYLIGEKADDGAALDLSCAAMMQGPNRKMRAMNYDLYLSTVFGDDASKLQKFALIPGARYDVTAMFGSACGLSQLFGDGGCAPVSTP